MKYNPNSNINNILIQELSKIEYRIIEYYKQINQITKRTNCILNRQLLTGNLKIYKDYNLSKINKTDFVEEDDSFQFVTDKDLEREKLILEMKEETSKKIIFTSLENEEEEINIDDI